MTRALFVAPLRIEIVVRPIAELRLLYGGRSRVFVFDERGDPEDVAPWFLEIEAEKGTLHLNTSRLPDLTG